MKNLDYDKIYRTSLGVIEGRFPKNEEVNENKILEIVESTIDLFQLKNFSFRDTLVKQLKDALSVKSSTSSIITNDEGHEDWYDNSKKRPYWETYRDYLTQDLKYSISGVNDIDLTTDQIMSRIEDPLREGAWDSRGLVVGSVQSGKTSNFIGLLNKAVDAGYKNIVVLSGLHKNLRQQTQKRIDDGLLGYDTQITRAKEYLQIFKRRRDLKLSGMDCLTNSSINGDFKTSAANHANIRSGGIKVMVLKKNKTVLQNVIKHFCNIYGVGAGIVIDKPFKLRAKFDGRVDSFIKDQPILVIDDEVDNGSVDTGEQYWDPVTGEPNDEYNPKTINRLIRQLLNIHQKKCFIGYTATPFANIFIHEDGITKEHGPDLFPKNFIIDLPIPSNHSGIEKLFPKEVLKNTEIENEDIDENPFFEVVNDHSLYPEDRDCSEGWMPPIHKKDHEPIYDSMENPIPPSLRKAVISFVISCVIRNMRGHITKHKSMLIHASRFVDVQNKVHNQIENLIQYFRNKITSKNEQFLAEIEEVWEQQFVRYKDKAEERLPTFNEILNEEKGLSWTIIEVSKNIKRLNGSSNDELNYDDFLNEWGYGMQTIVIGGEKLSRGLTLEGLSVSYFLRSAKMPMYDTLMQMGRWFGYRQGYGDLCRLYTTRNVIKWFFFISLATDELRNEFNIMMLAKKTPKEFGLRVRDHEILAITSKTKMRHSKSHRTSYSGVSKEFKAFKKDKEIIKNNFNNLENFLGKLEKPDYYNGIVKDFTKEINFRKSYQWINVETNHVVNYLNKCNFYETDQSHKLSDIARYIQNLSKHGELTNFTVSLFGNGSKNEIMINNNYAVDLLERKARTNKEQNKISLSIVSTEPHEAVDLTENEFKNYLSNINNAKRIYNATEDEKKFERLNRGYIRYNRSPLRGNLNIYPIYYSNKDKDNNIDEPLVAISLSFPNTQLPEHEASIPYQVNSVHSRLEGIENI